MPVSDGGNSIAAGSSSHRGDTLARLSLEYKLPLLIGTLLLATIIAIALGAYLEMRRTAVGVASERLVSVTAQLRDLFQQSAAQLRTVAMSSARKAGMAGAARTALAHRLSPTLAQVLEYDGPGKEQVIATQLRDSTGTVLASIGDWRDAVDTVAVPEFAALDATDSVATGTFRVVRDSIVYPVVVRVPDASGTYMVRWRRLGASRRAREQMVRLIGSEASLYIGAPAAGKWTDLETVVEQPDITIAATGRGAPNPVREHIRADGRRVLAAQELVPGTPWMVVVDFPMDTVIAPVGRFIRRMVLFAMIALGAALLAAWFMSRRITTPLVELSDAATAITRGDFSHQPRIDRDDELGQLGTAFASMATEVQHGRALLESRVEQRTQELNHVLKELRDAQETLVRREKLAIIGQLASGVGHELRNPLGVMTNAIYFLRMVLNPPPSPQVAEYLDILQQQVTLSEKIVGDLLDFARLKQPQRRPTSMADVTRVQVARLGPTNGVKIETDVLEGVPPVLVDEVQVGQIVLNLLTNAVQAMDSSGCIVIRAHSGDGEVHYEVADNGPGIAPDNVEKIFEPLFTTKARGIGLGLAVSRTLARANQGDLTVVSLPGQGATFRLTLPIAAEGGV